jgi:hypothetical protein
MRYSLWSRGRLVGHTDLDVHTVTSSMRQGFVEPTEQGRALLADATCVWRAIAEVKRATRTRGERTAGDDKLVMAAMQRRENLDFELRDEQGNVFECEFMRVSDLFDMNNGLVDEMSDTQEEEEAKFEVELSRLSGEARDEALAQRAKMEADIQADVEMILTAMQENDDARALGSAWPPPPADDPRWDSMQYLLQVHLKAPEWDELFSGETAD